MASSPSLDSRKLRERAAHEGCSMEDEACLAPGKEPDQPNLGDFAADLFGADGLELEPHPPIAVREAPDLEP